MSDRIAVMNRGPRRAGRRPPRTSTSARDTTFVAGFIGVSNLMPGVVSVAGGDRGKVRLDSRRRGRGARSTDSRQGERCHAVVRPEKLRDRPPPERPGTDGPSVEGVVESSVFLGTSTQIVVRLAGDVPMTVLVPNADEAERQRLPGGGARVQLSLGARAHARGARVARTGQATRQGPTEAEMLDRRRRREIVIRTKTLAWLAAAIAALALALGLAACGGDDGVGGGEDEDVPVAEGGEPSGDVLISNWPGYIDPGRTAPSPSSRRRPASRSSTSRTSTTTSTFFNKLQPQLDQGELGRPQHLRRHRLDGEADVRPRLPAGARPRRPPDRVRQHPAAVRGVHRRPRAQVLDSVAGRHDRDLGRHDQAPEITRSTTCSTRSTRAR